MTFSVFIYRYCILDKILMRTNKTKLSDFSVSQDHQFFMYSASLEEGKTKYFFEIESKWLAHETRKLSDSLREVDESEEEHQPFHLRRQIRSFVQ